MSGWESGESNELYTCLGVEPIRPRRVPDPGRPISNTFNVDRTREVQPEVGRIKLCNGASERMSDLQPIVISYHLHNSKKEAWTYSHHRTSTLTTDQIVDFGQDASSGSTVRVSESIMNQDTTRDSGEQGGIKWYLADQQVVEDR